ncbi:hypothetical protein H0H81_004855, partial [Sphagnurus paluster]
ELGILHKIGCITLDNASNCNSMMVELVKPLAEIGIPFSVDGNRIHCFPHVINLCVKAGIRHLTQVPASAATVPVAGSDPLINSLQAEAAEDQEFIENDVVSRARDLVTKFHSLVIRRRFVWLPGPPFSRFSAQVQLMKEPKLQPDQTQTDQQGPEPTTPTQSERPRRSRRRPRSLDAAEAACKKADQAVTQAAEGARRPAPVTTCQDQRPVVAIITGRRWLTHDFDFV